MSFRIPLIFLSVCSLFPLFSFNPFSYEHAWLFKGFSVAEHAASQSIYHLIIPVAISVVSLLVAWWAFAAYVKQRNLRLSESNFLFKLSYNHWYIDAFYRKVIVKAVLLLSNALYWFDRTIVDGLIEVLQKITLLLSGVAAWADRYLVDGFLYLVTQVVKGMGNFFRGFQSGRVQYYLFSMLAAVLAVFIIKLLI